MFKDVDGQRLWSHYVHVAVHHRDREVVLVEGGVHQISSCYHSTCFNEFKGGGVVGND